MKSVIEFRGSTVIGRYYLSQTELREIGDFTRENVQKWMDTHTDVDWIGILPTKDFHAICGDIDIPWATEESRQRWNERKASVDETEKIYHY